LAFFNTFCSIRRRPISSTLRTSCGFEPEQVEGVQARGRLTIAEQTVPVSAVAGPQANALAVLEGEDAEAVVLQLVDPAVAVGHVVGEGRLARHDEAGR
jgi:hypothetical protein